MSLPSYLDLVNDVLVRMREPEVTTVQENTLSKLVGRLVNDSKRQVENAYNWNSLTDTLVINTEEDTYGYVLNGSGQDFRVLNAKDVTNNHTIANIPTNLMTEYLLINKNPGKPLYYNFNGVHDNGDTKVDFYPVPEAGMIIYFDLFIPQPDLVLDTDTMLVPRTPVTLGAFARALVERGEDGGLNSSEAYGLAKAALADAIAVESSRFIEEEVWGAV